MGAARRKRDKLINSLARQPMCCWSEKTFRNLARTYEAANREDHDEMMEAKREAAKKAQGGGGGGGGRHEPSEKAFADMRASEIFAVIVHNALSRQLAEA